MRCRVCGLELEAQDKLRNGAYRCPECGTIHHTASSSRKSPSPWRKRRGGLAQRENPLTRRLLGLPLWGWLAALAVVIAVVIVIVLFVAPALGSSGDAPAEGGDMPAAPDVALTDAPAAPEQTPGTAASPEASASVGEGILIPAGSSGKSTGIALNDFVVGFEWAMNYLKYTDSLVDAGQSGSARSYTYSDWIDVSVTLDASGSVIQSLQVTARLAEGATDSTPIVAAFVSALYGLDNTTNANIVRSEIMAMLSDSSRAYGKNSFTAKVTDGGNNSYVLSVDGLL